MYNWMEAFQPGVTSPNSDQTWATYSMGQQLHNPRVLQIPVVLQLVLMNHSENYLDVLDKVRRIPVDIDI